MKKTSFIITAIIIAVSMAGCAGQAVPEPTITPMPTITPLPTITPTPEATPEPVVIVVTPEPQKSLPSHGVTYMDIEDAPYTIHAGDTLSIVNCKENITLREYPSADSAAITKIPLYSFVTFKEDMQNGFIKVGYRGKMGYILKDRVSGYEPQVFSGYGKIINCEENVSLRTGPYTSEEVITTVPLGASVTLTFESERNGFLLVNYNGSYGWVLADRIQEIN